MINNKRAARQVRLLKTEDEGLYIIQWSAAKSKWELRRKLANSTRTLFLSSCEYKTPLIMTARRLQQ